MLNIFISSIVLTTVSIGDLYHQYLFLFLFLFLFTVVNIKSFSTKLLPRSYIYYFPLFCFMSWIYGIILALLFSVPFEAYIRNFAALFFYLLFYIIFFYAPSVHDLKVLFNRLALIYSLISLFFIIQSYFYGDVLAFDDYGTSSIRMYFSVGTLVLFIPVVFIFFGYSIKNRVSIFGSRHYWGKGVFVDIFSLIWFIGIIIASGSKGFYLALIVVILLSFIINTIRIIDSLRIRWVDIFLLTILIVIPLIYFDNFIAIVNALFDLEFDDLHPRVIQQRELVNDFSLLGRGIGSSISSGYSRDDLGYGYELSFHNVIHKLGLASLFIFFTILYPFFISAINIMRNKNLTSSLLSFSLMLYIFPAYGNPFLISPITVTFNVVAFYLVIRGSRFQRGLCD